MSVSPEEFLRRLESKCEIFTTPCGEGEMVWRRWGKGAPLVLLHGGSGSWKHWVRNIEALAQRREVWAVDLPGMGESAEPPMPTSFIAIADIVARGFEQLAPGAKYDIAGFSFGSVVAHHMAHAFPDRVRKIVLINGHMIGPFLAQPRQMLTRWRAVKDPAKFANIMRNNLKALMMSDDSKIDALAIHLYAQDLRLSRIRPGSLLAQRDHYLVAKIQTPTIVIAGALDPVGHPSVEAQAAEFMAARPDAHMHILRDTGHWAMYEAPEAVNELLLAELG